MKNINTMKIRTLLLCVLLMLMLTTKKGHACAWYSPDTYFFNLFSQQLINDPRYTAFLMTEEWRFYESDAPKKNANIEEWQGYLGLSYDDTRYLVFTASRDNVRALINGTACDDKKLAFVTKDFVSRHKQALLYIAYAKYLEPYMRITKSEGDDYSWGYSSEYPDKEEANKLEYDKVITVLTRSWSAETDKELKLRYGYQLVRFAHYNRKYEEAVKYFDTYVEPLNYKTEMYYYALSQKAGALRGLGNIIQANADFMSVFSHSDDLKQSAYSSMFLQYDSEVDFENIMSKAKNDHERNDIYLLLGYKAFNNPLNEIRKIVAKTPDAIQAKVLMARAINSIERRIMPVQGQYELYTGNNRYPAIIAGNETESFLNAILKLSTEIAGRAKDKDFWNMATSYLYLQKKDFAEAKKYLDTAKTPDEFYRKQKNTLAALIEICEQPTITKAVEEMIFSRHIDLFLFDSEEENSTAAFVRNVLANRYFIQKDYAKSFLMTNKLSAFEMNPQESLLNEIEKFHNKKDKNNFEKLIAKSIQNDKYEINDYFKYLHGVISLTNNDLNAANGYFKSIKNDEFKDVSSNIFGYNIIKFFDEEEDIVMRKAYISEFPVFKKYMSYADITGALIELDKTGKTNGEKAAKANFLIGNFYYNVSSTGYFRHYLRFDNNNSFWYSKYTQYTEDEKESEYLYRYVVQDDINTLYIKYDSYVFFKNTTGIADTYLQKALQQTNDNELKALILFALAKVDQIRVYAYGNYNYDERFYSKTYFEKLKALNNTTFVGELNNSCEYFNYYVNK